MEALFDRLTASFTGFDWWMIILWAIVGALMMRRITQLPVVVGLAFIADTISPFFWRVATGTPPDFAFDLMLARLDSSGLAVLARIFIYFLAIGLLFAAKVRWGRR
ncbi:hypothetical protein [Hyphobacterium marinum]|uniref:Uncharacterized protein n=1 Tax=Hyphobacterium marinum TaxID=3116574 RepID=A0ABU7LYX2_9PROT|nr:hypothetical protein [Hyphobacterium sp. Y6023]MEE2566205.1 hypothetical protein [Hyphobacterium sp. Y6023]